MFTVFISFPQLELLCSVNTITKPKKGLRCQIGMIKELLKEHMEKLGIFK